MEEARPKRIARGEAQGLLVVPAGSNAGSCAGRQGNWRCAGSGAFLGRGGVVLEGLARPPPRSRANRRGAGRFRRCARAQPPLQVVARPLFNTREGYGSAVVPGGHS